MRLRVGACAPTAACLACCHGAERNARMQDQTLSLKRFGEDLITIQQRVDQEKVVR